MKPSVCYTLPMPKGEPLVTATLRYPRAVRDKLKKIAERERRSLNDQLIYALERWLESQSER